MTHSLRIALALGASLSLFMRADASTTLPQSFSQLVSKAEVIWRGEVVATRPEWRIKQGARVIVTIVSFNIERVLKGNVPASRTVEFIGGMIGDQEFVVHGMPRFEVGDRDVLFVTGRAEVFPVLGGTQGRFKVSRTGDGTERVLFADGTPASSLSNIGRPRVLVNATPIVPFRLEQFEAAILDEVRRGAR